MKQCVLILLFSFSFTYVVYSQDLEDEGLEFQKKIQQDFLSYVNQEALEFQSLKENVLEQWDQFQGSTKKEWVEYSKDLDSRSLVNFEEGKITIEVLVPEDSLPEKPVSIPQTRSPKKSSKKKASKNLSDATKNEIENRIMQKLKKILDPEKKEESPIADQVKSKDGKLLTSKNLKPFVKNELMPKIILEPKPFVAKDGKKRYKAKVSFKMVPEHLRIRAEKFRKPIELYSQKHQIETSLTLAVIHTESFFNPKARSHIPAYGLMQLVPSSGVGDAYRFVFKKDKIPPSGFLYNPENNIRLGTGYLRLLQTREFRKVKNPQSVEYLIIASYNTGAGNVSRAIIGKKNIKLAVNKINQMTPDEVYQLLKDRLHHSEARDYIQKVTKREEIYQNF